MNLNTFELVHEVDFSDGVTNECQETWVELDDLIAPVISELNKKGYKTLFSCSGHAEGMITFFSKNSELYPHAYITFDEGVIIPKNLIPEGWKYEKDLNSLYFHYSIYSAFTVKNTSNLIKMQKNQKIIMSVMTNLFDDIKKWPKHSLESN